MRPAEVWAESEEAEAASERAIREVANAFFIVVLRFSGSGDAGG
jgi:hypothetical protein